MKHVPSASAVNEMESLLDRLERWLAQHRPHYWRGLLPGADTRELTRFRRDLRGRVPASLCSLLAWHNGQTQEFIGCFSESWKLMGTQAIVAATRDLAQQDPAAGWRTAWIPFLDDDAGDYLCLDPGQKGAPVRAYWQAQSAHPIVSASLTAWLRDLVQAVERGEYVEDPERGYFLRRHAGPPRPTPAMLPNLNAGAEAGVNEPIHDEVP